VIEAPAPRTPKLNPLRVGLAVAVAVAIGVVLWLVVGGSGGSSSSSSSTKAHAATQAELTQLAAKLKHPIYWTGPKAGYTYELTQTDKGNVYVRYLPQGVQVGDSRADFVTVGTYPDTNPMRSVATALKRKGTTKLSVPNGGVAVQDSAHPTSVYLAFPNSSLLLEIFAPNPSAARSIAKSGTVVPLG
jgi:hypothetical protein